MLEKIAEKYYTQGYNCAETLLLTGNEAYQLNLTPDTIRTFAAFGGGLQCGDVCGALCGCLGVISAKYIPTKAHDYKDQLKAYANKMVNTFQTELNGRTCDEIKPQFHHPETKCLPTVKAAARALEKVIQEIEQNA
ncbi:MAG: C-GCAxxG-C-C family (seleno)protein [Erysipelotrichaceae bacterium]|nr:C-GCAxxG-C-C family (seleno)protein [Erysipelotrichaceae bacterium]